MNSKEDLREHYVHPSTQHARVALEESVCIVASGKQATVKMENESVTVEEYQEVGNVVEFE